MKKLLTLIALAIAVCFGLAPSSVRAAEDLTRLCGNFEVAAGPLNGIYSGRWEKGSFRLSHTLVVMEVNGNAATVLYAYGRFGTLQPACFRVEAKLENDVLTVPLERNNATATYKVKEDGTLSATYRSPNGDTPGRLSLVTSGPYMSTKAVQQALTDLGYNPGPVDGAMGGRTRNAIRQFQVALNLTVDGEVSAELAAALQQSRQTMETTGVTPADLAVFANCQGYSLGEGELVGLYVGRFDDQWGDQDIGLVVSGQTKTSATVLWAWANGTGEYSGRPGCYSGPANVTTNAMTQNPMLVIDLGNNRRVEVTFSPSSDRVSVNFHNTANGGLSQGYVQLIPNGPGKS